MAYYTGCSGSIVYGGTAISPVSKTVAKVRDWSLETSVELLDISTIDNCSSRYLPGRKSSTGSATLMYYRLEAGESNYAQFTDLLNKIQKVGDVAESDRVLLTLRVGTLGGDDIQFYAYINQATVGVSTGEITQVQISFTVDGDFLTGGVIA